MTLDNLRRSFIPERIQLLVVAESPPPRIGFFYDLQAREGALSRTTRQAMERAVRTSFTRPEFLDAFKRNRCYLYDLFPERGMTVNVAADSQKEAAVRDLADLLRREKPEDVVSALKRVDPLVRRALAQAGLRTNYVSLPFPSRQWTTLYRDGLEGVFRRLAESNQPH